MGKEVTLAQQYAGVGLASIPIFLIAGMRWTEETVLFLQSTPAFGKERPGYWSINNDELKIDRKILKIRFKNRNIIKSSGKEQNVQ